MKESDELAKARNYAFLLLKYRLRSKEEVAGRLRRKKFSAAVIDRVIASLEEKGYLDDKSFACAWISARSGKRFGSRRIRQELRLKGVDPGLIEEGLRRMAEAGSEEETIRAVAEEKLKKLKDVDRQTARRRIYAYFLRRGFSPDAVIEVLNGLI